MLSPPGSSGCAGLTVAEVSDGPVTVRADVRDGQVIGAGGGYMTYPRAERNDAHEAPVMRTAA